MSYTRVNWQDVPSVSTPLSASNLNKMDAGIEQNANDIEALQQHTYDSALNDTSTNAPQTKAVKKAIEDAVESVTIITDPTLSNEGQAADAKATGEAVAQVKSQIDKMGFVLTPVLTDNGYISASDGLRYESMGVTKTTDYIPVNPGAKIFVHNAFCKGTRSISCYSTVKKFKSALAINQGDDPVDIEITIPANAYYIRITAVTGCFVMYNNAEDYFDLDGIIDNLKSIADGISLTTDDFTSGYVSSTGRDETYSNNSNIVSAIIDNANFDTLQIYCDDGYQFNICTYNGTTFVQRSGWYKHTDGIVTVNNTYNVRINVATVASGTSETMQTVLSHINILVNRNDLPTVKRGTIARSELDYLNRISCAWTPNKICHYSVDDVYAILKDLTTNANTYTSIFDNATLAELLSIHNDTGMCVTLNTFNLSDDDPTYSIANVPEKAAFKTEFQANKGWLKFAFHAESTTTDYSTASGISAAYDTFVSAIYKLTGDYDCIDRFTRLGYFGGTLANVLAIKNKTYGITGLLCADTTNRASYYLSDEQNDTVQQKGMCLDLENQLVFIKTITRSLGTNAQNEVKNNLCYQKYVEFFSHEYESSWLASCRTMCQWAEDNGYVFAFPSLIFDVKDTF